LSRSTLAAEAAELAADLVQLRRSLHRAAEVGLQLPKTQALVLDALVGSGLELSTGRDVSSVVGVLRGASGGPAVLLRGDMDALPLTEQAGADFAAPDGVMHACGHDLHTAGLVGAARLLSASRDKLAGDVVFMFQPGEEGWNGAGAMIDEGVLDAAGRRVSAAYGLHVFSNQLPSGVFATRPGPMMAASSQLTVTVHGHGGHASRPSAAADPIVVAAEMVTALQVLVTRQFDVFDPVVITVGQFHAGTRRNIIPGSATFDATIRTLSDVSLEQVRDRSTRLCSHLAQAYGLTADVSFVDEYPLTANDPEQAEFALAVAAELFGAERAVTLTDPIMGSEDFSRVLSEVPGAFVFLGACTSADPQSAPTNHSPYSSFDESVLPDAALLLAELATRSLERLASR
jgi:amidohydrolase